MDERSAKPSLPGDTDRADHRSADVAAPDSRTAAHGLTSPAAPYRDGSARQSSRSARILVISCSALAALGLGATVLPFALQTRYVLVPWLFAILYGVGIVAVCVLTCRIPFRLWSTWRKGSAQASTAARWSGGLVLTALTAGTAMLVAGGLVVSALVILWHVDITRVDHEGRTYLVETVRLLDPLNEYHLAHGPFLMERDGWTDETGAWDADPAADDSEPASSPPSPGDATVLSGDGPLAACPSGEDVDLGSAADAGLVAGDSMLAAVGRTAPVSFYEHDDAAGWSPVSIVTDEGDAYRLVKTTSGLLVAGTGTADGGENWVSFDGGDTWTLITTPAGACEDPAACFLADAGEDPSGALWVDLGYPDWDGAASGTPALRLRSVDEGATWTMSTG